MQEFKDFSEYIVKNYKKTQKMVEIGIGSEFEVFNELLKQGFKVIAVDINPKTKNVLKDDITNPEVKIYSGAKLIYSIRPPPELYPYIEKIARMVGAELIIRPLSTDYCKAKLINYKRTSFYKIL